MLTAGEMLNQQRVRLKLTFTQLSESTKIPQVTLKALEKNNFSFLPGFTFLQGMVQNYAKALSLDPAPIIAALRRDYDRSQKKSTPALAKPVDRSPLLLWLEKPAVLFLAGLILLTGIVGWSLWRIYQPPRLIIDSPQSGQTVISPIQISGRADRDASLTLNDGRVNLEPDGNFRLEYPSQPGELRLIFKARSRRQKENTITLVVNVLD